MENDRNTVLVMFVVSNAGRKDSLVRINEKIVDRIGALISADEGGIFAELLPAKKVCVGEVAVELDEDEFYGTLQIGIALREKPNFVNVSIMCNAFAQIVYLNCNNFYDLDSIVVYELDDRRKTGRKWDWHVPYPRDAFTYAYFFDGISWSPRVA